MNPLLIYMKHLKQQECKNHGQNNMRIISKKIIIWPLMFLELILVNLYPLFENLDSRFRMNLSQKNN